MHVIRCKTTGWNNCQVESVLFKNCCFFIGCWFLLILKSPCRVDWVNVGSSFSITTLLIHNFIHIHALSNCPATTAVLCCCMLGGSVGEGAIKLVVEVEKSLPLLIFMTKHPSSPCGYRKWQPEKPPLKQDITDCLSALILHVISVQFPFKLT